MDKRQVAAEMIHAARCKDGREAFYREYANASASWFLTNFRYKSRDHSTRTLSNYRYKSRDHIESPPDTSFRKSWASVSQNL